MRSRLLGRRGPSTSEPPFTGSGSRTVGSGQGAVLTSSTLRIVVDGAPNDSIDLNGQEFHVDSVGGGEGKDNTAAFALRDDYEEVSLLGTSDTAFMSEFPDHTFPITVPPSPED